MTIGKRISKKKNIIPNQGEYLHFHKNFLQGTNRKIKNFDFIYFDLGCGHCRTIRAVYTSRFSHHLFDESYITSMPQIDENINIEDLIIELVLESDGLQHRPTGKGFLAFLSLNRVRISEIATPEDRQKILTFL